MKLSERGTVNCGSSDEGSKTLERNIGVSMDLISEEGETVGKLKEE